MFSFDTLSLLFVALIVLGSVPNLFYTLGYLPHIERKSHFLVHYVMFIASMIGVVIANNALVFLFAWELMSLTSWQLILTDTAEASTRKAARFYFFMTHFGFVFLLLFFLIAGDGNLELPFSRMHAAAAVFAYPTLLFILRAAGLSFQGRGRADACLAALCPPRRAVAGLGADERGDAQGRHLRAVSLPFLCPLSLAAGVGCTGAGTRRTLITRRRALRPERTRYQGAAGEPLH